MMSEKIESLGFERVGVRAHTSHFLGPNVAVYASFVDKRVN